MKGFRRFLRVVLGLLAFLGLLLAGGWWWLNRYVEGPEFAAYVKKEGTRITGVPVDFKSQIWELGRGITLIDLSLRNGTQPPAQGEFKAGQIILKYDWSSLLDRRFEITRLTLKEPVVVVGQDAEGNYVLPIAPAATTPATATSSVAQTATATTSTATSSAAESSSPITMAWKFFNLEKGSVEVKNSDGSRRLLCSGIEMEANSVPGDKPGMKGWLRIGEIWLLQKVKITSVRSPMVLDGDTFSLSPLEADAYGGRITGSWEQNFSDPKKAYNLKLNIEDCDVNAVLSGTMQKTGVISGRVDAKTLWLGPATDPLAVSGKGTVELHNAQLIQVPLFQTLAQLLGVSALAQPDISEGKIEFTVADQVITISSMQLKSALFELSTTGTIGFNSTLNLQCRLDLSPELAGQLPSAMVKSLEKRDNGYSSLPFKVGGTLDQPKVELVVTQGMINQAADLIKGLFGKKNKDKDKTATPPAEAPAPTPTTAPASTPATTTPAPATATSAAPVTTPQP